MSISCTRSELTAFFFSSTTAVLSTVCHFPFTFLYISPFHSQVASKRIGRQSAAVPTSGATDAVLDRKLRRAWVSLTPQIQQAQIQQPPAQAQIQPHPNLVKLVAAVTAGADTALPLQPNLSLVKIDRQPGRCTQFAT